jgi:hypothetical protein
MVISTSELPIFALMLASTSLKVPVIKSGILSGDLIFAPVGNKTDSIRATSFSNSLHADFSETFLALLFFCSLNNF